MKISRKMCQRLSRECSLRTTREMAKIHKLKAEFLMIPTMSRPNTKEVSMITKSKLRSQKLKTNLPRKRKILNTYLKTRCTKRISSLKVRLIIPRDKKTQMIHK